MLRNVILGTAFALFIGIIIASPFVVPPTAHEPYITISTGEEFSEREYHRRVRGQIARHGFQLVCVTHLLSLDTAAKTYDVNRARMNLVLVTECAKSAEGG